MQLIGLLNFSLLCAVIWRRSSVLYTVKSFYRSIIFFSNSASVISLSIYLFHFCLVISLYYLLVLISWLSFFVDDVICLKGRGVNKARFVTQPNLLITPHN